MKIRNIILLILFSMLSACAQIPIFNHSAPEALDRSKHWDIPLVVTQDGGEARMRIVKDPMPACTRKRIFQKPAYGPDKKGCMKFTHGEQGRVTFDMSGNVGDFRITQFKICKGDTPPEPMSADCELSVYALDFYVLDMGGNVRVPNFLTGKIEWEYDDDMTTFVLHDRNLLKQKYYYLVVACDGPDPNSDTCLTADPPLDNDGLK